MFLRAATYLPVFLVAILAACGGGGSGGGNSSANVVSITGSDTPLLAMQTVIGGSPLSDSKEVKFNLDGDLDLLAGKTIYVSVTIPIPGVTGAVTYGYLDTAKKIASFSFNSFQAPTLPVGVYQDTISIKACLDIACNSQLGGSPYKLPFKYTVAEGITVSQDVVNLTSAFGTKSAPVSLGFTLPPGGRNWSIGCDIASPPNGVQPVQASYALNDSTVRTFNVEGQVVPPGSYSALCNIFAYAPSAVTGLSKKFTVNYTVTDNGQAAAFSPSEISYNVLYCFNNFTFTAKPVQVVGTGPIKLVGIEYLSEPAAHTPSSDYYRSWISNTLGTEYAVGETITVITQLKMASSFCLPTGVYKARLKFQSGSGASLRESYLPVTLTF